MNPVNEKVKDIVDVLSYKNVKDFEADPKATLSGYHFTDITSEMMGRWLDRISMVHARGGGSFAIAGFRGVGKSHFLATLGAIVSHTELRSVVTDPHVAAGAQRLLRRHYPVVHVRRGTAETLLDEFAEAVGREFPGKGFESDGTIENVLAFIDKVTGEMPAVILVDTAFERGVRVSRDDGTMLGKISELIKDQNIFIGVALDDDIAGADGVNADIARTYSINYLDPEHLYTVVNRHVFPKHPGKESVLSEVYRYFRTVLPNFRWSEQKFASLYPLHPSILEVAPFIRLHVHDFALLGFASEAGQKILGRPAMSLIALDEVFDKVEHSLRAIEELSEPFAAYDHLNKAVISKIPVIQRLQAKLILKALMLLSLDGRGASAAEIAESMLIYDESDPDKAIRSIEEVIAQFSSAMPQEIRQIELDGREPKFGFRMSSKDELNIALDEKATLCDDRVVGEVIAKLFQDRYPDGSWSGENAGSVGRSVECTVKWRGSIRRGRLSFVTDLENKTAQIEKVSGLDWSVKVELFDFDDSKQRAGEASELDIVIWRPDNLTLSEKDTLRRFSVLTTNTELRSAFSEQLYAPLQSHSVAAARILKRSFLDDGKLIVGGYDFNFSDEARESQSLSDLFSLMLETYFDTKFPEHPEFGALLGPHEANSLISGLYGGSELPGFSDMVQNFAVPLGLVRSSDGRYEQQPFEQLSRLPYIKSILELVQKGKNETVSLDAVSTVLNSVPFGLVRESQRVILTALVAARKIDFVTTKGDRIKKRSLDLRIIWDDINGIAGSIGQELSNERLIHWAALFSGNPEFRSFTDKAAVATLRSSLELWLKEWRRDRIFDRFEMLSDEMLNTRIWRISASAGKTYTVLAEIIGQTLANDIEEEDAILQIASLFADSDEEYARRTGELDSLRHFVRGTELRDHVLSYASTAEFTGDSAIETVRLRLMEGAELCILDPSEARNREVGHLFDKFRKDYTVAYTTRHDEVMHAHHLQEKFASVMASDDWNEFHALSQNGLIPLEERQKIQGYSAKFRDLDCSFDSALLVSETGACQCHFSLETSDTWAWLPAELMDSLAASLKKIRLELQNEREIWVESLEKLRKNANPDVLSIATRLVGEFRKAERIGGYSLVDASVLRAAKELQKPTDQATSSRQTNKIKDTTIEIEADSVELVEV